MTMMKTQCTISQAVIGGAIKEWTSALYYYYLYFQKSLGKLKMP